MKLRHQIFFSGSRQIVQANIMWFSIARQACANSQSTTSTSTTTAPVEARLPSSSPPPLLPGKNLVTVFSAICLALSKDFNSSNTWSWPSTTSWTMLRISSRSCRWSCPSTSSLSGPTRGLQQLYGPGPSFSSPSGPRGDFRTASGPGPSILAHDVIQFFPSVVECQHNIG